MKIAVAADHGGFPLKEIVKVISKKCNYSGDWHYC